MENFETIFLKAECSILEQLIEIAPNFDKIAENLKSLEFEKIYLFKKNQQGDLVQEFPEIDKLDFDFCLNQNTETFYAKKYSLNSIEENAVCIPLKIKNNISGWICMFGKEENLNKWKDCYDCLSKLLSLYLIKASGWDKESIFKAKLNSLELSERQKTIAELLLSGKSNKDIAYKVNLSEQAIKYHIGNMLEKFKCKNRRELRAKITGLII